MRGKWGNGKELGEKVKIVYLYFIHVDIDLADWVGKGRVNLTLKTTSTQTA